MTDDHNQTPLLTKDRKPLDAPDFFWLGFVAGFAAATGVFCILASIIP
jgi:hypothetical protein